MSRAVATVLVIGGLLGCSSADATTAERESAGTATTATGTTETAMADETVAPGEAPASVASSAPSEVSTAAPGSSAPTTTPSDPVPSDPVPSDPVSPAGFDLVQATVTTAEGEVCELCLWVASTASQRRQGLMGVTDLGEGDGMAFVYDAPHTGSFWMKNTPLSLSIAFFDPDGGYLDAFDMEPCTAEPCPLYPTASNFLIAIETEQGRLGDLGIGDGSRLALTDLPCE